MAPQIQTYHCICTSLVLASTHTLSSLPRRSSETGSIDSAIILPLPDTRPSIEELGHGLPPEGYTMLLGIDKDRIVTIIRRQDGFEKRLLYRCSRCRLILGYGLDFSQRQAGSGNIDKGKRAFGAYEGKILYLLPRGLMSTEAMMGDRKLAEDDVGIGHGAIAVFE